MFIVIGSVLLQIPQSSPEMTQIIFIPLLTNLIKWMFCMQKCLPIKLTQVGYCIALTFNLSFYGCVVVKWHCTGNQKVAGSSPVGDINI